MNHSFAPSIADKLKCNICKFPEIAHGNEATCDCCPNIGPVDVVYGNMLMCKPCQEAEKKAHADNMTPEKQQERVNVMNASIEAARAMDTSISVRTDLFNAATVAIIDVKKTIDENPSITNKPYALAEFLTGRFNHFKKVIFDANEAIVEAGNQQKAIQVYLNNLSNQLRAEEREKLKIADINYTPAAPKLKKVKPVTTKTSKKLDKKELEKYAKELGVSSFTLQMVCVQAGISPEQAANRLRKSINEAKSESTPTPIVEKTEVVEDEIVNMDEHDNNN